jgi:hypothetical protein
MASKFSSWTQRIPLVKILIQDINQLTLIFALSKLGSVIENFIQILTHSSDSFLLLLIEQPHLFHLNGLMPGIVNGHLASFFARISSCSEIRIDLILSQALCSVGALWKLNMVCHAWPRRSGSHQEGIIVNTWALLFVSHAFRCHFIPTLGHNMLLNMRIWKLGIFVTAIEIRDNLMLWTNWSIPFLLWAF